ncbi:uncharacterized protein TNCV_3334841 [Trichonephila clavipes]|nr:uncharacterized protein TNCV_3334841 [Trichonephila clavipes]
MSPISDLEQVIYETLGRIIGLREGRFSYREIRARVQRNSSTVIGVLKHWTDEPRTARKTRRGQRKVTSARGHRHLLRMVVKDHTTSSRQLAARWSTATGRLRQFVDVCCTVDCVQGCFYTGSPSRQTIDGYVCNGLMSIEPDKLTGTKLCFQMSHVSICGTVMTAFVLDAMQVNAVFQSALSNNMVA